MNPKKANIIFWIAILGGALVGGIGASMEITWIAPLSIVIMMGGLFFRMMAYRCPHCGKYLDRSSGDFCPHCGKRVNE